MRRREFISLIGSAAATWPLNAGAQGSLPIVGFAISGSSANQDPIAGFEAGLKEMGFVQGQNLAVEYRFAEGKFDRFPALISDLVPRKAVPKLSRLSLICCQYRSGNAIRCWSSPRQFKNNGPWRCWKSNWSC